MKKVSRHNFLGTAARGAAALSIVPRHVLGGEGQAPPSEKVNVAAIGMGTRGPQVIREEEEKPHVRHIDPEVGVWHTVKLTIIGRSFSAEYDGEILYDNFVYHDWMINMEPAPIRLQKHIVMHGDNLGAENPCPIEYRNIFIKEIEPAE